VTFSETDLRPVYIPDQLTSYRRKGLQPETLMGDDWFRNPNKTKEDGADNRKNNCTIMITGQSAYVPLSLVILRLCRTMRSVAIDVPRLGDRAVHGDVRGRGRDLLLRRDVMGSCWTSRHSARERGSRKYW
jgi:hypothetical protein